jgi:hypothetical protein
MSVNSDVFMSKMAGWILINSDIRNPYKRL